MKKHKHNKSIPIKCLMGFHKWKISGFFDDDQSSKIYEVCTKCEAERITDADTPPKPNSFRCSLGIHKFEVTNQIQGGNPKMYDAKCQRCGLVTKKSIN